MAVILRSPREIEKMRAAGQVVAAVLRAMSENAKPGVSTAELNEIAESIAHQSGAKTLFKGVVSPDARIPFPGAICSSINEQVVHGIPSPSVKLSEGDIISIDFGVKLDGYCGDSAVTIPVGKISPQKQKLIDCTKSLVDIAIKMMAPGLKWSEIAAKMQAYAESNGFSVVRDFVGHGIGTEMHAEPQVPNYVSRYTRNNDIFLKEGMVLAVEPMVNTGKPAVRILKDGWTVVTADGKPSAHFEHTIAVVKNGCEVLTA